MITQKELKELVNYDLDTGLFTWKFGRVGVKKGAICGSKNKGNGYIEIMLMRRSYLSQRVDRTARGSHIPFIQQQLVQQNGVNRLRCVYK